MVIGVIACNLGSYVLSKVAPYGLPESAGEVAIIVAISDVPAAILAGIMAITSIWSNDEVFD
jgi:hypothetical protein